MNKHRKRAIRGIVTRRVRDCARRLLWVRTLTESGGLPRVGMTFVFLCPRCAQLLKVKRIRVHALESGATWQHELPKCAAFVEAFERIRSTQYGVSVGWLGAPLR